MPLNEFIDMALDILSVAAIIIVILIVAPIHLTRQPSKRKRRRPKYAVRMA